MSDSGPVSSVHPPSDMTVRTAPRMPNAFSYQSALNFDSDPSELNGPNSFATAPPIAAALITFTGIAPLGPSVARPGPPTPPPRPSGTIASMPASPASPITRPVIGSTISTRRLISAPLAADNHPIGSTGTP